MKKYIATIWAFAISAVLVSTVLVQDASAQAFSQSPLIPQKIAFELTSPEAIVKYLWKNFRFENDQRLFGKEEYWQSPEEFLKNGKGDCEDFAAMASLLLTQAGKKSFMVNIYGNRYAHTICVFVENGKYHAVDGAELKRYNAGSLQDLITQIHSHWDNAAIVTRSAATQKGRILKQFDRDHQTSRAFSLSF